MYSEKPNFAVSRAIAPNTSSSHNAAQGTMALAVVLGTIGTSEREPIVCAFFIPRLGKG
ncbi:hypothetical protein [Vacuolonema iberomarrocanum]|uniref:hypothetical protein n=1 Tax=Vacuolonema iberomarrocanum TaxID=3454632 RepID=UPI0019E5EB56|nr:hypothetical protein [filamentous cyanobacterium LEGE 07170]